MPLISGLLVDGVGTPVSGLSPTVRILNGDSGALVVGSGAMVDRSATTVGIYTFDFDTAAGWTQFLRWVGRIDGTATLPDHTRYQLVAEVAPAAELGDAVLPPHKVRINPAASAGGNINLMFWLERNGKIVAVPTDFTFEIRDGANLVRVATVAATAGPSNAHGVYFRSVTPDPALAVGDTYSVLLSITDAIGTVSGEVEGIARG